MQNDLYKEVFRRKYTGFWNWLGNVMYYQLEYMPLKQKMYIFLYNMNKKGHTTLGESKYFLLINTDDYLVVKTEFDKDYSEFIKNPHYYG